MTELNKYFNSTTESVSRLSIKPAEYNPRKISDKARKDLKAHIKKNGIIGGFVWNKRTGTLVSGHQKLSILDELNKFGNTEETDYVLKVEVIDVDEKTEKELNVWFNNTAVQGEFDYLKLAELLPDIDYTHAGLSAEDLQFIGIDFTFQTDGEKEAAADLELFYGSKSDKKQGAESNKPEMNAEAKKQHVKNVKELTRKQMHEDAEDLDAYVMVGFDTEKAKAAFMQRFGLHLKEKYIKGEWFNDIIEYIG